jgi:hypothetical protein
VRSFPLVNGHKLTSQGFEIHQLSPEVQSFGQTSGQSNSQFTPEVQSFGQTSGQSNSQFTIHKKAHLIDGLFAL